MVRRTTLQSTATTALSTLPSLCVLIFLYHTNSLSHFRVIKTPLRIPEGVKLYKETLPSVFSGLTVGTDLSNRTSIVSASTSWTIWYDNTTGINYRSSAADALLWAPSQQRSTLTVLAEHKVAKVIFNCNLTATGVLFGTNTAGNWTVYASKEVILAAGSLASAPILERSGVGSSSVLKAAGIKQVVNLPGVGTNLCVSVLEYTLVSTT